MSSLRTFTASHLHCDTRMQARFSTSQIYTFRYERSQTPNLLLFLPWSIILPSGYSWMCTVLPFPSVWEGSSGFTPTPYQFEADQQSVKGGGREPGKKVGRRRRRGRRERSSKTGEFLLDSVAFSLTQEGRLCAFSELCVEQTKGKDALDLYSPREPRIILSHSTFEKKKEKLALSQEKLEISCKQLLWLW